MKARIGRERQLGNRASAVTGARSRVLQKEEREREGSPERDGDWAWERTREANWTFEF